MKANIHDFEITGIQALGENSFVIRLFDPQYSVCYVMKFMDVQRLYVDGFTLQNIVLDLNVYTNPSEDFGFKHACGMLDLDMATAKVMLETGSLVLIEAASGAEIACILGDRQLPDLVAASE